MVLTAYIKDEYNVQFTDSCSPLYREGHSFAENFAAVQKTNDRVYMNKEKKALHIKNENSRRGNFYHLYTIFLY